MSDESEKTFVDAVFAAFGTHDWEDSFKTILLNRTEPTNEEWEVILPSNPPAEANMNYAQGVHDGLKRFLVDPEGYIKKNIKPTDPRHAALVEIAAAQKTRDAAAAAAPPLTARSTDPVDQLDESVFGPAPRLGKTALAPTTAEPKTGGPRRLTPELPDGLEEMFGPDPTLPRPVVTAPAGALSHAASPKVGGSAPAVIAAPTTRRPASDRFPDPIRLAEVDLEGEDRAPIRLARSPITPEMRAMLEDRAWASSRQWVMRAYNDSTDENDEVASKGTAELVRIRQRIMVDKSGQNGSRNRIIAELMSLLLRDLQSGLRLRNPDEFLDRYYSLAEYRRP